MADPALATKVMASKRRPNNHQVARAGRHYVAAELHRRAAYDVLVGRARSEPDVYAADSRRERSVSIRVKTKTAGDWQVSIESGRSREAECDPTDFWILVDLREEKPVFYVMPAWWIETNIYDEHRAYLARHGGQRARTPDSKHHRVTDDRVEPWRERWDLLKIFD